ncbi:MAG: molybdopterin molybdenumtransferase MoeA, partial [Candidatus Methanofastidiosa archaeon]|nr:molybdopterin molybdenumtransferase MoeA [Candidatus Methanofastidiosa archaeon]
MKFLKLDTYEEAIKKIEDSISFELKSEDTPISSSLNRILSEDLISPINVPDYPKSQMDGYAVRSEDTFEASETSPVKMRLIESVNAGSPPRYSIKKNTCSYVATGAPVPDGADSVVMIENTQLQGEYISLSRGVTPGEN